MQTFTLFKTLRTLDPRRQKPTPSYLCYLRYKQMSLFISINLKISEKTFFGYINKKNKPLSKLFQIQKYKKFIFIPSLNVG